MHPIATKVIYIYIIIYISIMSRCLIFLCRFRFTTLLSHFWCLLARVLFHRLFPRLLATRAGRAGRAVTNFSSLLLGVVMLDSNFPVRWCFFLVWLFLCTAWIIICGSVEQHGAPLVAANFELVLLAFRAGRDHIKRFTDVIAS